LPTLAEVLGVPLSASGLEMLEKIKRARAALVAADVLFN
jgi:hypothetical protein